MVTITSMMIGDDNGDFDNDNTTSCSLQSLPRSDRFCSDTSIPRFRPSQIDASFQLGRLAVSTRAHIQNFANAWDTPLSMAFQLLQGRLSLFCDKTTRGLRTKNKRTMITINL